MIYRTRTPAPPLGEHVERLWFYSGFDPDHGCEKLLPDGAVELIVDLGEGAKRKHDATDLDRIEWFERSWISGMHRRCIVIGAEAESSMIGVRFRSGGAGPYLPFELAELNGRVVELDRVFGRRAAELRDELLEAPDPDGKFDVLESFLRERAGVGSLRHRLVPEALRRLRAHEGPVRVSAIAADLGVSHEHLVRIFRRDVGLSPKAMHRVFRFMRVVRTVHGRSEIDWPALALDCGYHDQAHFANEFRDFAGLTPGEYLRSRTDTPFYVVLD